ncbi:MAG: ribonuclease R [Maioricimonas sp. JB049]
MSTLAEDILAFIGRSGYKPLKPKNLAKKLGVTRKRLSKFDEALDALEAAGDIRRSSSGRIQPKSAAGLVAGVMRRTSSGKGFVIPHEPRPANIEGDIFIDQRDMSDAYSGDEVLVRLLGKRRSGGQRCGVIVDVLERATNTFVGTYFEDAGAGWVEIDGTNFNEAIWVGDPGAKGAQEEDKVVIEMLRFPSRHTPGEAVVTKVLGGRGEPGVDTLTVIHEYGLPDEFPEDVLNEARLEAENFNPDDLGDREDLTQQTVVTVDPADARDFDDAISLERTDKGHWLLGVHIADVAHFVQPGSALDREAQQRGNSVYLPTRVLPMLPEVISNGLASLQEEKVRYTKSAFIEFTEDGTPVHTRFARTAVRVTKRFAYEQVLPVVKDPERHKGEVPARIRQLLADMHELAMTLRARRFRRGALELDMPEIELEFDKDGRVSGAHEAVHDESHQIIEEFMLAANIAVATKMADLEWPFLRRVHGSPAPIKLKAFSEFAAALGYSMKTAESRSELQRVLSEAKGEPEEYAINYALLRSLKRAEYLPAELGHYALAEDHYCHFTSPIRRYPDLVIHRLMDAMISGKMTYAGPGIEGLMKLGLHCSTTERRADSAERELTQMKLLHYLESRIGDELEAVITGVERFGVFCRGTELPAEGLVHISTLAENEIFDFDRTAHSLVGRRSGETYRLGDRVRVSVAHVNAERRELDMRLLKRLPSPGRRKPSRSPGGKSDRRDRKSDGRGQKSRSESRSKRSRRRK